MSNPVISVEKISKRYLIGHQSGQRESYNSLRDVIAREARNFVRKTSDLVAGRQIVQGDNVEEFWALRDVSFNVEQGDVLGVVGRNGAGKSTLLKILSRITEPTRGRITIKGRIASLLEVGTGFHPELTGRENVYLNGAILGMSQREIRQKFDEIVAFAEFERFLDTPVKQYSSGMYIRLAFAVAVHLNPEILLVDEILAVGDTAFQKKCLRKLASISANEGRTVVFVSHNTAALLTLCRHGALLKDGSLVMVGTIKEVIEEYYSHPEFRTNVSYPPRTDKPSITFVSIDRESLKSGNLAGEIRFESPFPINQIVARFAINTNLGNPVFASQFEDKNLRGSHSKSGTLRFELCKLPLASGNYTISVWLTAGKSHFDHRWNAISFAFRPDLRPANEFENTGYLDWPVDWRFS
jgi:lipopolysaccharide transport system ATP-binding protein